MGKVLFTSKKTNEVYEFSSTHKNSLKTVRDLSSGKVKEIHTNIAPNFNVERSGGKTHIEVVVSSTESEDNQLLRQLYKLST